MPNKTNQNVQLTGEQLMNALAMAVNGQLTKQDEVEETEYSGYINKFAVALMKSVNADLSNLRYDNGLPVEKAFIDDIDDILGNFNRSGYVTGTKAQEVLEAVINRNDFFNRFSVKYGNELTIPIDVKAYAKRQLTSTKRLGRQLTATEKSALASISGFELFMHQVELQYDISMFEIRNNLHNPNFENEILVDPMLEVMSEDLLDLATNGTSDSYTAVSYSGFESLAIGYEYLLKNLNGTWTNSNGTSTIIGKFGHYHTPHRIKISYASDYDGSDIVATLDDMIDLMDEKYLEDAVIIMSKTDAGLYRRYKANATATVGSNLAGINTAQRDIQRNYGLSVPHEGLDVVINPKAKSIANGGCIVIGNPKLIYVGMQRKVEQTREYQPRLSTGGSGIEHTKIMYVDFQIALRNAFCVAAADLAVEDPTMIQSIVSGSTVYTDRSYNKGTAYTSSATPSTTVTAVTVYCDTPNAKIYKHVATAFDDGTDLPADALPTIAGDVSAVTAGDMITLTDGQRLTLRAYQVNHDGTLTLTPSSLVKFGYDAP